MISCRNYTYENLGKCLKINLEKPKFCESFFVKNFFLHGINLYIYFRITLLKFFSLFQTPDEITHLQIVQRDEILRQSFRHFTPILSIRHGGVKFRHIKDYILLVFYCSFYENKGQDYISNNFYAVLELKVQ